MTYASAKDIQAKLPADEVLVEYYYDDKKVYAFVITRASACKWSGSKAATWRRT